MQRHGHEIVRVPRGNRSALADMTVVEWAWFIGTGVAIIALIWMIQAIIGSIAKRKLSKDAANGISYVVKVISAFIILFVSLSYFNIVDFGATLNMATVFSTAIGFSCTIAVGNFVAGLYLLVSRPYSVGDYVRIGAVEGFVDEIGLNYSTIRAAITGMITRLPNRVAMNETLWVYKVSTQKEKDKKTRFMAFKEDKRVRYTQFIESELSFSAKTIMDVFNDACNRWTSTFGYTPEVRVDTFSWRIHLKVVITADDMNTIQDNMGGFLDDIWVSLHGEQKEAA